MIPYKNIPAVFDEPQLENTSNQVVSSVEPAKLGRNFDQEQAVKGNVVKEQLCQATTIARHKRGQSDANSCPASDIIVNESSDANSSKRQ